jgi:lipopolysaccharide transport system permease protein
VACAVGDLLQIDTAVPAGAWRRSPVVADARRVVVLRPPGSVLTGLLAHLSRLPRYRDLLWTLTVHRIRVRYKQSALGWVWAVLQPLLLMLIFTLLFSVTSSRVATGGIPYTVFVYAAVLPWSFFSTAVGNGTNSLVGQAPLVTKVWFPREILPLSYVTAALFDFLVASLLLVALMLYHHVAPTWLAVVGVPLVGLMSILAFAVGVAFAAVQVRYRDVGIAMPLLLQVWMFLSPVVYPYSQVPTRYRWLYQLNPMAGLIEGFRRVTVLAQPPDWRLAGVSAVICLLALPVCYLYFKYVDATVADRL